ncbi:MAG TPA: TlpA disulfide reductase family protein, partial [Flavisolibacter sp.]|nr:TlpA disulfide reductase family protein [Flavisolibacter sp.]
GSCTVSGTVEGLQKGAKAFVIRRSGEHGVDTIVRSIAKENGEFSLTIPATACNEFYDLRFEGVRNGVTFIAEKGKVEINGNKDRLYAASIAGTPENDRWNSFQKYSLDLTLKQNQYVQNSGRYSREEMGVLFAKIEAERKHYSDSLISHFHNSLVSLYLARVPLMMMKHSQIDSVLVGFKPYFAKHKYYLEMKQRADVLRKVAKDVMAPDFTVMRPEGSQKITLSSFRGKYVLLDFWASWCVPCRAENVHTKEIYEKYHPYGLEVISFSLDSEKEAWKKAIEKDGLVWNNASDLVGGVRSPVAKKYGIVGIPAIWLIDPSGKIIAEGVRGQDLDKLLAPIFIH